MICDNPMPSQGGTDCNLFSNKIIQCNLDPWPGKIEWGLDHFQMGPFIVIYKWHLSTSILVC